MKKALIGITVAALLAVGGFYFLSSAKYESPRKTLPGKDSSSENAGPQAPAPAMQNVPGPHTGADIPPLRLSVNDHESGLIELSPSEHRIVGIKVLNQSQDPITVAYLGVGTPEALAKVENVELPVGREATLPAVILGSAAGDKKSVPITVGYLAKGSLKTSTLHVVVGLKNPISFEPESLHWNPSDRAEKIVTVRIPSEVRMEGASAPVGFDVRVEGDKIRITPPAKGAAAGTLRIQTSPRSIGDNARFLPLIAEDQ